MNTQQPFMWQPLHARSSQFSIIYSVNKSARVKKPVPTDIRCSTHHTQRRGWFSSAVKMYAVMLVFAVLRLEVPAIGATIETLPIVAGEAGYETLNGWTTIPLTPSEVAGLSSGSVGIHLASTSYPYAGPHSYEIRSPSLTIWYDASSLVEGSPITFTASAVVCDLYQSTILHYSFFNPLYEWPWTAEDYSWDTAVSADTQAILGRGGWAGPPLYWVTSDNLIGLRVSAGNDAGGGLPDNGLPPPDESLDVSYLRITGEVVPEPTGISITLMGVLGSLVWWRCRKS